jgi:hypothetical protein
MSDEESSDALFEAAKRLFEVFIQPSGDKFQCVLDQRCFSTRAIATAHLCKSHVANLRELMPEDSAESGAGAVQESGVVEMEEGSQPQAVWSQEQADELVALQMALDDYNAHQQQMEATTQQQCAPSRDQPRRRPSSSTGARQTPRLERTPSSATKRGRAGEQAMTKQERLLSLLSKTDDILQTVQRAVEQEQARQQIASSSSSSSSCSAASPSSSSLAQSQQRHQPLLLTGGALYDFQLQGVSWLSSLHASGLNGILADEMGLGKTVQVIGFLAALAERFRIIGPHLITVPLGVLRAWQEAFEQWCPTASVVVFHGTKYAANMVVRNALMLSFIAHFIALLTTGAQGRAMCQVPRFRAQFE